MRNGAPWSGTAGFGVVRLGGIWRGMTRRGFSLSQEYHIVFLGHVAYSANLGMLYAGMY